MSSALTLADAHLKYTNAVAFRQALEQRLKNESAATGHSLARLRKRVAFELFLHRLLAVAPDRWVLKGALALDFRLGVTTRSTKNIDLGRDDEQAATRDIAAAQQLAMDDFFTFAAVSTDELKDTVLAARAGGAREDRLGDQSRVIEHRHVPDVIEHDELRCGNQLTRA